MDTDLMAEDCTFCAEVLGAPHKSNYSKLIGDFTAGRILWRGELTSIFPSLGPIVNNHLLLVPNKHIFSYAHASPETIFEVERVLKRLKQFFSDDTNDFFVFEHGAHCLSGPEYNDRRQRIRSGACTDHAHLHIIPSVSAYRITEKLTQLPSFIEKLTLPSLNDLSKINFGDRVYISTTSDIEDGLNIFLFDQLPSQLMRQLISVITGNNDWDWRQHPHPDKVKKTLDDLSPALSRLLNM